MRSPSSRRGPTACFATDWHAAYRARVLAFIADVGLGGLETDGQYEGAACTDQGHDHRHNGVAGSWAAQLEATRGFNRALKALGVEAIALQADAADTDAVKKAIDAAKAALGPITTVHYNAFAIAGSDDPAAFLNCCAVACVGLLTVKKTLLTDLKAQKGARSPGTILHRGGRGMLTQSA